jgi:hypothetical protein
MSTITVAATANNEKFLLIQDDTIVASLDLQAATQLDEQLGDMTTKLNEELLAYAVNDDATEEDYNSLSCHQLRIPHFTGLYSDEMMLRFHAELSTLITGYDSVAAWAEIQAAVETIFPENHSA